MHTLTKLGTFLLITGCIASVSSLLAENTKTVLALVNGTEITSEQIQELPGVNAEIDFATLEDERKTQIIIALTNRQLVIEQARKEGFDQSERIANALKNMQETYIVKQYLVKVATGTNFSEEVLKAYYEDNFSNQPEQYEVAHILLATEEEASAVLELLKQGAGFSSLAIAKSQDKVSAVKEGELGWLTSAEMVPSFYKAVSELKPGGISSQPTKTQFGWHIVRLDGKREPERQPLDEVRQQIQLQLIKDKIAAYLEQLREQASIEIR